MKGDIDFQEHLDTARLWWDLDDAVLQAIAEGRSTAGAFRSIALYVLELKAASTVRPGEEDTPAITKIAVRIAGAPQLAANDPVRNRAVPRRRPLAVLAAALLVALALVALLTAAAAAEMIRLPESITNVLDRIGVHVGTSTDGSNGIESDLVDPDGERGSIFVAPDGDEGSGPEGSVPLGAPVGTDPDSLDGTTKASDTKPSTGSFGRNQRETQEEPVSYQPAETPTLRQQDEERRPIFSRRERPSRQDEERSPRPRRSPKP